MSTPVVVLLLVLTLVVLGAVTLASEPGPNAGAVLVRRYGLWPFLAAVVAAAGTAGVVVAPHLTVTVASATVGLAGVIAVACGWGPGTWWRAARRCVLRARWTSVARSSDLAVHRDHRRLGIGADTATLTDVVRLEWTPTISRGRALPGGRGVVYRLTPARGSSIPEIAAQAERLAAGLAVARVIVERERPNRGRLVVLWRDEP